MVSLQELKVEQGAFPVNALRTIGYEAVWQGERSWNGVAILARNHVPVLTCSSLPGNPEDHQARYIEAAVQNITTLNTLILDASDTQRLQTLPDLNQFHNLTDLTLVLDASSLRSLPDMSALKQLSTLTINLRNSHITNLAQVRRRLALQDLTLDQNFSSRRVALLCPSPDVFLAALERLPSRCSELEPPKFPRAWH